MSRALAAVVLAFSIAGAAAGQPVPGDSFDFIRARLAANAGETDKALAILDELIRRDPRDPVLQFERATILLDDGQIDRAAAELRRVVAAAPDFYDAQKLLGRVLIDLSGGEPRKIDEARLHLEQALRLQPGDVATGLAVTQIYLGSGRSEEAARVLALLAERAPDHRTVNYQYAQVLTRLGRASESKVYLERVVASEPTFGPAALQLADLYAREGSFLRAAEVLDPLIAQNPLDLEMQRQQAFFFLRGGAAAKARDSFASLLIVEPKDLRTKFFLAEALNDLREYAKAGEIYRELLQADPGDPELLLSYGLNQLGAADYDGAERAFRQLLDNERIPPHLRAVSKTQLAAIAHHRKNYDEALKLALEVVDSMEQPVYQAVNVVLDLYRRRGEPDRGVTLLEGLTKRFSDDQVLRTRLLEFLSRAGKRDRAAKLASEIAATGTRGALTAAQAYMQADAYPRAIEILEKLRTADTGVEVLFQLGAAYERAGRVADAEKLFLNVLEQEPKHAPTLNYLGYMWADRNTNLERARQMLELAVSLEPRNGAYVDSLGWVYYRLGDYGRARKHLLEAAALLPTDATVQEHLGDVYLQLGDEKQALAQYRLALANEPEEKSLATLKAKIADLETRVAEKR